METLTAATASSMPSEAQLITRVRTPSRHTLKDRRNTHIMTHLCRETSKRIRIRQCFITVTPLSQSKPLKHITCDNLPNQSASGVADQAEEHQQTDEHVKQQQR